jgi:protein-L-isoaspartate(D-aspartate) O-methyltransferase
VYTVERHATLAQRAEKVLAELGYDNVVIRVGDGTLGWPEHSPYEAIIVTAAAPDVPQPLIDQLADGGRLVAPVGSRWSQVLVKVKRQRDLLVKERLTSVAFVPLIGEYGWKE